MSRKPRQSANVFVALLRGVNVGGNNMISMSALKNSFTATGFQDVTTYINSGNIVFKTKETDPRKLELEIEKLLAREYKLDAKVIVRSLAEMEQLVKHLPPGWDSDRDWRYNVIFLRHTIDSQEILQDLPVREGIEEVIYVPGTLLWSARRDEVNGSEMLKFASRKLSRELTTRNTNTTRKLLAMMTKAAETGA